MRGEIAVVAANQEFMAKQFHDEVIEEAGKINDSIENLRDMIQRDHSTGTDRSFLKAKIETYEACLP